MQQHIVMLNRNNQFRLPLIQQVSEPLVSLLLLLKTMPACALKMSLTTPFSSDMCIVFIVQFRYVRCRDRSCIMSKGCCQFQQVHKITKEMLLIFGRAYQIGFEASCIFHKMMLGMIMTVSSVALPLIDSVVSFYIYCRSYYYRYKK